MARLVARDAGEDAPRARVGRGLGLVHREEGAPRLADAAAHRVLARDAGEAPRTTRLEGSLRHGPAGRLDDTTRRWRGAPREGAHRASVHHLVARRGARAADEPRWCVQAGEVDRELQKVVDAGRLGVGDRGEGDVKAATADDARVAATRRHAEHAGVGARPFIPGVADDDVGLDAALASEHRREADLGGAQSAAHRGGQLVIGRRRPPRHLRRHRHHAAPGVAGRPRLEVGHAAAGDGGARHRPQHGGPHAAEQRRKDPGGGGRRRHRASKAQTTHAVGRSPSARRWCTTRPSRWTG